MTFRCQLCPTKAAQTNGRWASVLRDGGGAPVVMCPACADKAATGVELEVDPKTGQRTGNKLPPRAFESQIWRF